MKWRRIGFATLFSLLTTLNFGNFQVISNSQSKSLNGVALAQTLEARKAEADRFLQQGRQQFENKQYEAVIQSLQQALAIFKEIGDRQGEAKALAVIGLAYIELKNFARAIEYLTQSLPIARSINNPKLEIAVQQALSVARSQSNPRITEANRLLQQGIRQFNTSQFEAALESFQQALIIYRETKDRQGEGWALGNSGFAYLNLGNYQQAIKHSEQWLAIAKEIKDRQSEAAALGNLAGTYLNLGEYPRAIDYLDRQLAIAWEIEDQQIEEVAVRNLGIAYLNLGNYQQANEYFEVALAIARRMKNRQIEGIALGNLANVYIFLGDYPQAIEYSEQWLAIAREIKDRPSERKALENLGLAYLDLNDYQRAIKYLEQQLAIAREMKDRRSEGKALGSLGIAYLYLGDYSRAIEYSEQWLAIARETKDRQSQGIVLGNLGVVYRNLGDYPRAIAQLEQQLAIAREMKDRQREGIALGNLGSVYLYLGNYPQAIKYLEQQLAIARKMKDRRTEGIALNNIGLAVFLSGNVTAAEKTLTKAIEIFESLRAGLKDSDKVSIFETQSSPYRTLQKVLVTQNKTDAALEISERGRARAFVELLAQRLSLNSEKRLAETTFKLTIAQIRQIAKAEKATFVQYSIINHDFPVQGKQNYQETELYIWVIKPTGEVIFRKSDLKPLWQEKNTTLANLVTNSRESIGVRGITNAVIASKPTANQTERLQQLHQILIEPISDLLPSDPNSRVIFVPQFSLFLVPFPALQDKSGKYLIEKHTILTAPSIQVLELIRQQKQKSRTTGESLVVGNPIMPTVSLTPGEPPQQLSALPAAEKEAMAIAPFLNTKAITGSSATKENVVQKMLTARIIHLATHGLLDDVRGLGSAIALTPSGKDNGLLTAEEILDLKLSADLVVLSACDTGRGKITGDGVVGLSRSFISAGVPSIIVSLWAVPDAPTAELMTAFYQNLQTNPNKAQALRQAMLKMMKTYPHPKDWAAFTLIGEAE